MPPRKATKPVAEVDEKADAGTSTVGNVLKLIYKEVKNVSSTKAMSEKLAIELKSVQDRVDNQAKSLSTVVASTESLNKTLEDFLNTIKDIQNEDREFKKEYQSAQMEYQKTQIKHWANQDALNKQLNNLLDIQSKNSDSFKEIYKSQSSGCTFATNLQTSLEKENKHINEHIVELIKANETHKEEIKTLMSDCKVHTEKISVVNKRIADLELAKDFNEFKEADREWKRNATAGILTAGGAIILALAGIVYSGLAK